MSDEKIRLIFEKCPRDKANDKKLPSDSFVVSYNDKEELKYDIGLSDGVSSLNSKSLILTKHDSFGKLVFLLSNK